MIPLLKIPNKQLTMYKDEVRLMYLEKRVLQKIQEFMMAMLKLCGTLKRRKLALTLLRKSASAVKRFKSKYRVRLMGHLILYNLILFQKRLKIEDS